MSDDRKISICLTNYNRFDMLIESYKNVLGDQRISEIIIIDDASDVTTQKYLKSFFWTDNQNSLGIKLSINTKNLGCYRNKREAISKASNEFVIIFDSDNILNTDYIDAVFAQEWDRYTLFAPEFAKPHFDYRSFSGETITKENVSKFVERKHFTALINTMNYFVNRDEYLRVWEDRDEPWTADTALQNYNWLKQGNAIHVLPGLQYEHRIEHTEHKSHYQEHNKKTGNQFNVIMDKMRALR